MKISIALCTYNGEKFLRRQLESFAEQTVLPNELIVYDDVSSDSTGSILAEFARTSPFVTKITRNLVNVGAVRNFESAVRSCTGDIIFLSDQDDVWMPGKVETTVRIFEEHPGTELVFSDAVLTDEELRPLPKTLWQQMEFTGNSSDRFAVDPFVFLLTDHNVVTGAAAAFSKEAVRRSLPFPDPIAIFHDGWLALVASGIGPVRICKEPLLFYRQHADQQLGIRKLQPDFGTSDYRRHLHQLHDLDHKIGALLTAPRRRILTEYVRHLERRTTMSTNKLIRTFEVLSEYGSGRYSRYSSGIRSAGKDILRS